MNTLPQKLIPGTDFEYIFNISPDLIFILDNDLNIVNVNQTAADRLGVTVESIIGTKCFSLMHRQNEMPKSCPCRKFSEDHREHKAEFFLEQFQGWFSVTVKPLIDKEGNQTGSIHVAHDITDRKRVEATLQERERNLRAIFNATDESIFLLSADSTIIALNDVAATRLGSPSKELIGKKSYDILPPDVVATRRPYIEQALATGRHISFDDERNGRCMVNHLHPILDDSGTVAGLSIYSRDITWRREAEIALKENEEKYRQLVDNSPDAIFIYVDGKIVFANRESLRLLAAADQGELIGKPVLGFVHPDSRSLVMERMQKATGEGVVLPLAEEKFIRLDGSEVEAEVVALAVRYENKPAVQLIIREITERKKSEKALMRSEERLREVLENSLDATYKSDLQTNRYDYMSPVYSQLTGFAMDEILTMSVEDLMEKIHPDDRQKLMEAWEKARAGDAANEYQVDYRFRHKDGGYRWFHNKSHLLRNESGKPIARIGSISDITSRKQVEKELKESETRLQSLFDTLDEGVILINPDGKIVKANLAAEHILGISRSGIEGRHYTSPDWAILRVDGSLMPPAEMAGPRAMTEKQPVKDMVMGVCRPDGIVSWISVSATPMLNSQGELEGIVGTFANITKRKHAEDAVKAMALRNLTLLQTATDGIHVLDEVGNVVEANPAFCQMLGYTRDEMLKLNVRDWDMNWSDDQLQAKIDELFKQPAVFDTRHRRKDGTCYDVEINAVSVSLEGRKYLYNAARDISGRKRAEEFLEQTRNNYESFFNTIDELLFVLDTQGNIIYTNKTVTDRLGYSSEELAGQSVMMVHPPERREEAGRIVGEMLAGVTEYCPVPLLTKNGIQIPVETRVSSGFWDSKPVIFGVSKDISKIKFSEEKFSKLFFLNPSACGLSDINTLKYIEVNDAFCRLFGYAKEEVIGKTSLEMGIIDAETRMTILQNAGSNGKVTNVEARLKGKHGVIKQVLLSAENIFVQDQQYRFTLVHDITEIKKAEQEIKLINKDLIKLNAEKDKFFSIIAHDLRNPFNSLLGFSQMLVEDLPSLTSEDIQKIAATLRNSVTRLYTLLENLLEWSRMQRGQISFNPVSFVLSQGMVSGIELVHEASEKKNIRIISNVSKDLVVLADEQMFKSVVRNLVFNAVKFTPANGMIVINAKMVPGNFVQISITDTGIGMNTLILENLFLLDNQVNRKGTDGEPSTGLGLIICRDFIEKHGGRIWAESEEGKGATFYFTLPVNE